jgi:hypothetical protein
VKDERFPTEAALCEAFSAWARSGGHGRDPWTVYPETGGFDLLLVDKYGRQLGIEAKLVMNAKVCVQAIPVHYGIEEGPDYRGILVPSINGDLGALVEMHGLVVFTPTKGAYRGGIDFHPYTLSGDSYYDPWFDWNPPKRITLPAMVPDVPAGVPCPVRMTTWKQAALKVLAHLEAHGHITARQVKAYGVDPRRFCATDGWLVSLGDGRWGRGSVPAFDKQHPNEYAAFLREVRETIPL